MCLLFRFFFLTLSVGISTKIKQCRDSNVSGKVDGRWGDAAVVIVVGGGEERKRENEAAKERKREFSWSGGGGDFGRSLLRRGALSQNSLGSLQEEIHTLRTLLHTK